MVLARPLPLLPCKDRGGKPSWSSARFLYSRCRGPGWGGKDSDFGNDILSASGFEEHHYSKDFVLRYVNAIKKPLGPWEPILSSSTLYNPESTVGGELFLFWKPPVIRSESPLCHRSSLLCGGSSSFDKKVRPQLIFSGLMILQHPG